MKNDRTVAFANPQNQRVAALHLDGPDEGGAKDSAPEGDAASQGLVLMWRFSSHGLPEGLADARLAAPLAGRVQVRRLTFDRCSCHPRIQTRPASGAAKLGDQCSLTLHGLGTGILPVQFQI